MLIHRFRELQDEYCEISTRLGLAQTLEQKRELLSELQRTVRESGAVLTEMMQDSARVSSETKPTNSR
jgi:hypothetical protein